MAKGKRQPTPDILGDVLAPDEADTESASPETKTPAPETEEQGVEEGREEEASSTADTQSAEKRKATFYVREAVLTELEEGWFQLRQMADRDRKGSVSKSAIVDIALEIILEELKSNGEESVLADKLLE